MSWSSSLLPLTSYWLHGTLAYTSHTFHAASRWTAFTQACVSTRLSSPCCSTRQYSPRYSSQPTHASAVLLLPSPSSSSVSWDNVKRIVQTKAEGKTKSEWDGSERESWRWDKCLRQHERAIKCLVMKEHLILLWSILCHSKYSAWQKISNHGLMCSVVLSLLIEYCPFIKLCLWKQCTSRWATGDIFKCTVCRFCQ